MLSPWSSIVEIKELFRESLITISRFFVHVDQGMIASIFRIANDGGREDRGTHEKQTSDHSSGMEEGTYFPKLNADPFVKKLLLFESLARMMLCRMGIQ